MDNKINELLEHVSYSQQQIARIFEAQRHTSLHMSQIISSLPDHQPAEAGEHVEQVNGSIASYLNAMAELQQKIADSLEIVMNELREMDQGAE